MLGALVEKTEAEASQRIYTEPLEQDALYHALTGSHVVRNCRNGK